MAWDWLLHTQTSTSCCSSLLEVSGKPTYFTLLDNIERPHDPSPSVVCVFHTSHSVSIEMFAIQCRKGSWFLRAHYKGVSRQCSVCHSGRLLLAQERHLRAASLNMFPVKLLIFVTIFCKLTHPSEFCPKGTLKHWHFFLTFFFRFPFRGDRGSPGVIW